MTEIAVISDLIEIQDEDDDFLFLPLKKRVKVWYLKTKLPDGEIKFHRYATKPTGGYNNSRTSAEMQYRNGIIQDRINALGKEGFGVDQKYISLFMSEKITELILSRENQKINQHQKSKHQAKQKIDVEEKGGAIEEIDDSPVAKILRRHMQN